ncbi:hypothetical protein [Haladaptatus salinisoli]|uniref:hypothetical protein n=1 Tax=Haladaptatus salinisoli TaxID=2884876 RepID=UPI001D0A6CE7|nr:hypothetical protein [Haladaptatus salinisoli]
MDFALWAYPWDVLDEGVDAVVERLDDIGITEINLATNYHAVQAFLPHNPARKTFFARASSYFRPDAEYADLKPVPNETMGDGDWVREIVDGVEGSEVSLNSWTVGCHNSRLGLRRPEATIRTPFGDSLAFGLCPANPTVRRYLLDVLGELSALGAFDRIELESFDYMYGTGFGWHHQKIHARLGTLGEFLFGLCFCDHCRENAANDGVDVDRARRACREAILRLAEGRLPSTVDPYGWLAAHPEVEGYADARTDVLTTLFSDCRAVVDAKMGYYVGLLDVEDAWMQGADLARLADSLDYYTVIAYESSGTAAADRLRVADDLTPDVPLHAGLLPGHPAVRDAATVRELVDAVVDAGAERVSFYNYGLLPERNLDWIREAISEYA